MNRGISAAQAKRFYDRFGARQDSQGWYENPAVERMIEYGDFERVRTVFELGFGTGRVAAELLDGHLSPTSRYSGLEVSQTMLRLASSRLDRWRDRVDLRCLASGWDSGGTPPSTSPGERFDRFVATYVLDLMDVAEIRRVIDVAWGMLEPGGLICLVTLTHGRAGIARFVSWTWGRLQALAPVQVGGCRPVSVLGFLRASPDPWTITHSSVVCRFGVCSEVTVARRT